MESSGSSSSFRPVTYKELIERVEELERIVKSICDFLGEDDEDYQREEFERQSQEDSGC